MFGRYSIRHYATLNYCVGTPTTVNCDSTSRSVHTALLLTTKLTNCLSVAKPIAATVCRQEDCQREK